MYKCTECGLEYEVKPEYCDCGNDEFVLAVKETDKTTGVNSEKITKEPPETNNFAEMYSENNNQTIVKKEHSPVYFSPEAAHEPLKLPVHPAALIVFLLCLLISLLILFAWNPVTNNSSENKNILEEKVESKHIPAIDKLWRETPKLELQETVDTKPAEPAKKITVVPLTKRENKITAVINNTAKQQTSKLNNKPSIKPQQTKSTQIDSIKKAQEEAERKAEEARQKAEAERQRVEAERKRAEAEAIAAVQKAKKAAEAQQELHVYKINLRNTIGQRIDFTKVIGDGECIVSFRIDNNGKLINRSFSKQSENITLNNAVYNAIMATPSYYAPPSAYNNEILNLNIRFKNGNFAITLE